MKTTKKLKRMVAGVLASLMAMSGTANICAADTEENVHLSMAFWAEQSEIVDWISPGNLESRSS